MKPKATLATLGLAAILATGCGPAETFGKATRNIFKGPVNRPVSAEQSLTVTVEDAEPASEKAHMYVGTLFTQYNKDSKEFTGELETDDTVYGVVVPNEVDRISEIQAEELKKCTFNSRGCYVSFNANEAPDQEHLVPTKFLAAKAYTEKVIKPYPAPAATVLPEPEVVNDPYCRLLDIDFGLFGKEKSFEVECGNVITPYEGFNVKRNKGKKAYKKCAEAKCPVDLTLDENGYPTHLYLE